MIVCGLMTAKSKTVYNAKSMLWPALVFLSFLMIKKVPSVNSSSKRSILTALEEFDRKQKELFDRENSEREGIDNIGMRLLHHQRKN